MSDPIPVPVRILRLPRGPDSSGGRGFSGDSRGAHSRFSREDSREDSRDEQAARAALRERFLRLLGSARGRPVLFSLRSGLRLGAQFGAAHAECVAFQVDFLQTPLGIQASALLRCSDVLEFSFPLE